MKLCDKIKKIRKILNVPQKHLALEMKVSAPYISKLENGDKPISKEQLAKIKKALDIEDIPLTDEEIADFTAELQEWRNLINDNRLAEASELQPDLARRAELSCDAATQALYSLYSAGYFWATGDKAAADKTMSSLSVKIAKLPAEYQLRYLIMKGAGYVNDHNYKDALYILLEAEKMNKGFNIAPAGFFYSIAVCFAMLGYSYKAEKYIQKSRKRFADEGRKTFETPLSNLEAICCTNTGRPTEALKILSDCLRFEKLRANSSRFIGGIYHNLGCAYIKLLDYDKAIKQFNLAFKHYDKNSILYATSLYFKSSALIALDQVNDGLRCIDEGLSISADNELFKLMFKALKHSCSLNCDESLHYIENIAIPGFLEAERYLRVIEYCAKLEEHYVSENKYKLALKYSKMSYFYYKKIMEGRVYHE